MTRIDFISVLRFFGYPMKRAKSVFDEIVTVEDLLAWQSEKRWEIFRYHFENNSFYQGLVKELPLKWEDVPVLGRNDLKGNYLEKIPASYRKDVLYQGHTSGSSGNPLYYAHDRLGHAIIWKNVEQLYSKAGISLNDRQARFFGTSRMPVTFYLEKLKDFFANRFRFDVFDLSDGKLQKWVERFKKEEFQYIYGYTNSLLVFANYLIGEGIVLNSICPCLKIGITTSEMCYPLQRKTMEKAFGVKVFDEYGASELGIMGFKYDEVWEASDELIYFEVLDENNIPLPDGETGYLTCTALFNKATPFIRYRIGDLASIRRGNGRTYIEKIMGSLNDMAILPSGKKIPGISFYFIAEPLISKASYVKEFLVRQTKEGFEFEYVAGKDLSASDVAILSKSFNSMLEDEVPLKTIRVDKLQRGSNGKFKHFISEI